MDSNEAYIMAAKIISRCPKNRMQITLNLLKRGGISFTEEELIELREKRSPRESSVKAKRAEAEQPKWIPTTDPFALKLREAFYEGVSFTSIGRQVGLQKCTLYNYLYAKTCPSEQMQEKILNAIYAWNPSLKPEEDIED